MQRNLVKALKQNLILKFNHHSKINLNKSLLKEISEISEEFSSILNMLILQINNQHRVKERHYKRFGQPWLDL